MLGIYIFFMVLAHIAINKMYNSTCIHSTTQDLHLKAICRGHFQNRWNFMRNKHFKFLCVCVFSGFFSGHFGILLSEISLWCSGCPHLERASQPETHHPISSGICPLPVQPFCLPFPLTIIFNEVPRGDAGGPFVQIALPLSGRFRGRFRASNPFLSFCVSLPHPLLFYPSTYRLILLPFFLAISVNALSLVKWFLSKYIKLWWCESGSVWTFFRTV